MSNKEWDDDFLVEDEEIKTVFSDKPKETKIDEEEEVIPQEKDEYQVQSQLIESETDRLAPITVTKEMRTSFLEYAMSVIVSRALPDARDGLKPVHRRILYGMSELGVSSGSSHKKSARIVGDILGKYHPHGDSSVYEAMVRMSQSFSMRYPLVDGHGNFGSIDGDGAAAMRYTEARMSKISMLMVEGIKKNTVDFVPNYDGSEVEPTVLPAKFPNLLVTGATGIAVGMATNIPPHNLTEVISGVIAIARNPQIDIEELIKIIPAPDFPTGGIITGTAGAKQAYETGKGLVKLRAKTEIIELKNGRSRIVISEIPFMVNKAKMIEKIALLSRDKVITGITNLRDTSSRNSIEVLIDLSRDVVPEVVLNKLFKLTPLQTNFSINTLALVKGEPRVLNLKDALTIYLKHQITVTTRRIQFDLDKAQARSHILEGIKIVVNNIDEVIKIIKASSNDEDAQSKLSQRFDLSEKQAKAVTDMKLGRLTGLAVDKMNAELDELSKTISELKSYLEDREKLIDLIVQELEEIKEKFGDKRRTEIVHSDGEIEDEDLIPVKDIAISMTSRGYVKRIPLEEYTTQNRGGIGSKGMTTYEDDNVDTIITTTTHTDLLIFTSLGKVYRIRAHQIPEMSKQAKGVPFINIIGIEKTEKVISLLTVDDYSIDRYLLTVSEKGIVKKTSLDAYSRINKNGKRALGLKDGDMLFKAKIVTDEDEIILGSSVGKVVRFNSSEVRDMGRTATGVKGIDLSDSVDAKVVGMSITTEGSYILSVGENGFGKKTPISEYRKTKRGAKGVKSINVSKAGSLRFVSVVEGNEDVLIITRKGITIRTSLMQVATTGRGTKGVKIITLRDGNSIQSLAVINENKIQEEVEEAIRKTREIALDQLKQATESQEENKEKEA